MKIDEDVEEMLNELNKFGIKTYLVGGYVRDAYLGIPSNDYDIAINQPINAAIVALRRTGYNVIDTSKDFGTIAVILNGRKIDIAEFRSDTYDMVSRKPSIARVKTIEKDLERRDFTINSMAMEYPSGIIIDPYHGTEDLNRRTINTVRPASVVFMEDPLRMMRAIRFSAKYHMHITNDVLAMIKQYRTELSRISPDRIHEELLKGFSGSSQQASAYGLLLIGSGILETIIPELQEATTLEHDSRGHHYNESLAMHMMDSLERYTGEDVVLRIAIYLHDIGKMQTRTFENGKIMYKGHDIVGADILRKRLPQLKFTAQETSRIVRLVKYHLVFQSMRETRNPRKKLAKIFVEQREDIGFLNDLVLLGMADQQGDYFQYLQIFHQFSNVPKVLGGQDVLFLPPQLRAKALMKARYLQLILHENNRERLLAEIRAEYNSGQL